MPASLQAGVGALGLWAEAHRPELELVAQRRDVDGPMVDRALELVRQFIVDRGLILFGGLAIHYALLLAGGRLYPEGERPDWDFLSPRSVDDAYDLADLLVAAGFSDVGVVRGIHVQTMKVRTDFIWVADIGYAPPDVFARIPTLDYRGMRVAHPAFQRMDQLLAFCFPFNGPPHEDVFHRWRKDLKRFNLYEQYYPQAPRPPPAGARPPVRALSVAAAHPLAGEGASLRAALHGFAAYAALRGAFDLLAAAFGAPPSGAPHLGLTFASDSALSLEVPAGGAVALVSPSPELYVTGLADARWYDPYMDLVPVSVRAGPLAVYSTRGRLIGAAPVDVTPLARYGPSRAQALVVTPPYLLLHFLVEAHRAEEAGERAVYLEYYAHTAGLLRDAEALFAAALENAEGPAERAAVMDLAAGSPFVPTTRTLGDANHSSAYQIKIASVAERLHDTPPPALGLDPDIADLLAGLPQNYYPGPTKQRPGPYDYGANALFRRSGLPRLPGPG